VVCLANAPEYERREDRQVCRARQGRATRRTLGPMGRLEGKVAIVTGAGSGVG
jgi:hypothetical protein